MKRLFPFLGIMTLVLSGCAGANSNYQGPWTGQPPASNNATTSNNQAQINTQVQSQLEQAADSVQASLQQLAAIEKLQAQNVPMPLSTVNDPALNKLIAIQWYGPIDGLLKQIATSTGYQFQSYGKPPSLPVLINIDTTANPTSAINIIRNADLQAGLKVDIEVFQQQKVLSLRYTAS